MSQLLLLAQIANGTRPGHATGPPVPPPDPVDPPDPGPGVAAVIDVLPAVTPPTGVVIGGVLRCDGGQWSNLAAPLSYQWRTNAPTNADIAGATSSQITTTAAATYVCQVVGRGGSGTTPVYAYSNPVVVTAPAPPPPPPPPAGDIEKASGQPASASSTKPTNSTGVFTAAMAVDDDPETRFSSAYGVDNATWQVDLGTNRLVKRLEIVHAEAYASHYKIRTATASATGPWTERADVTISAQGLKIDSFTEITARYVQILCVTRALSDRGFGFWSVEVYGTDDGGGAVTAPIFTVVPAITGTPQVGQTLACSTGTATGTAPITYARAWIANGVAISPAQTGATLALTQALVNQVIDCQVTATGGSGTGSTARLATGQVTVQPASPPPPPPPAAPTNTTPPSITPTAPTTGQTLTLNSGIFTGAPILTPQWRKAGVAIPLAATWRVTPIGDSVTAGVGSRWNGSIKTALTAAGIDATFLSYVNPSEVEASLGARIGRGGWCTTDVGGACINGEPAWMGAEGLLDHAPGWLSQTNPDIVTVEAGINDLSAGSFTGSRTDAAIAARIGQIMDAAFADNANAGVFVTGLKFNGNAFTSLNAAIQAQVDSRHATGKNVFYLDAYAGFAAADWSGDNIHPSSAGYDKMATNWLNAIKPYMLLVNSERARATGWTYGPLVVADEGATFDATVYADNGIAPAITVPTSNQVVPTRPVAGGMTLAAKLAYDINFTRGREHNYPMNPNFGQVNGRLQSNARKPYVTNWFVLSEQSNTQGGVGINPSVAKVQIADVFGFLYHPTQGWVQIQYSNVPQVGQWYDAYTTFNPSTSVPGGAWVAVPASRGGGIAMHLGSDMRAGGSTGGVGWCWHSYPPQRYQTSGFPGGSGNIQGGLFGARARVVDSAGLALSDGGNATQINAAQYVMSIGCDWSDTVSTGIFDWMINTPELVDSNWRLYTVSDTRLTGTGNLPTIPGVLSTSGEYR